MAGLNRTLHFKPRINPGGDGVRVERLQKNPDSLYHRIVVMSNGGADIANNPKIIGAKFPSVAELRDLPKVSDKNGDGSSRQVIFFGTPFLLFITSHRMFMSSGLIAVLIICAEFHRARFDLPSAPERDERS